MTTERPYLVSEIGRSDPACPLRRRGRRSRRDRRSPRSISWPPGSRAYSPHRPARQNDGTEEGARTTRRPHRSGISSLMASAGSDGWRRNTVECAASAPTRAMRAALAAAKRPGFSCATSLPLTDRSATGSAGTGSGRGDIVDVGEAVDRRTRPHNGGLAASPSRQLPSPRRPMPPHAQDQNSPVRLAGWRASRTSWPTSRFPLAHGRKRPHLRDLGAAVGVQPALGRGR